MKRINNIDLISVILLAIIIIICITFPSLNEHSEALILYALLLFFLAVYSILTALSIKNKSPINKILIGILISLVLLFLFILSPNYLKITIINQLLILAGITLFFTALGYIKRVKTSKKPDKYLVCESCGGYYKLKKGESLEDFEACHCGGKLRPAEINFMSKDEPKRKKSIEKEKNSKKSKINTGKYIVCENCSGYYKLKKGESLEDFKSCHCGGQLKYAKYYKLNEKNKSKKFSNNILSVIILALLAVIAVIFPEINSIIRFILVLPLLFFLPGYSIINLFQNLSRFKVIVSSFILSSAITFLLCLIFSSFIKVSPTEGIIILAFLTILLIIISPFSSKLNKDTEKKSKLHKTKQKSLNVSKSPLTSFLIRDTQSAYDKSSTPTLSENSKTTYLDILLIFTLTFLCIIFILTPAISNTIFRIIFGIILVLFAPGYSLIAALFPKNNDINGIQRITFSFSLSIAVTPLIGLFINYTPLGIRLEPILLSLSSFTILMCIAAYIRRSKLPQEEKFSVKLNYFQQIKGSLEKKSRLDKILSIALVLSIVLAISTAAYVVIIPKHSEKFTEFYILGPNGKASDYPNNLTVGQDGTVTIGIANHEYADVNYTMIIKLNNQTIDNENITISNNQLYKKPFKFVASSPGQNQELEFLLYKLPDNTNVYRSLHLWINVK